jgi:hypothetical protein
MSTLSVNVDVLIEYLKDNTQISDIQGIVIYDVSNNTGNSWEIVDSDEVEEVYAENDISDASYTNAYFLPYSGFLALQLKYNTVSTLDRLGFYIIPAAALSYFTSPRINITSVAQYINTDTTYYTNQTFMTSQTPQNISSTTFTIPPPPTEYTTATLPILSNYTPEEIQTVFNTKDQGLRVVLTASEQTIASEVKLYLSTNGALPQFKNYGDYLAYKKAINLQNSLLNRYTL